MKEEGHIVKSYDEEIKDIKNAFRANTRSYSEGPRNNLTSTITNDIRIENDAT